MVSHECTAITSVWWRPLHSTTTVRLVSGYRLNQGLSILDMVFFEMPRPFKPGVVTSEVSRVRTEMPSEFTIESVIR